MIRYRKSIAVAAAAAVASVSLAACGGGGGSSSDDPNTLYYLSFRPVEHWDPQRVYIGRDIFNIGRLAYRSLVTNPVTSDAKESTKIIPDLATDTGKMTNGGKTWQFTIKDGVKWEDGKAITCEDFKYGISRTFATSVITGGPNYTLNYLDVPVTKGKDGQEVSIYKGPYNTDDKKGVAAFDKAVTCAGNTITYNFKKPFPDFPYAVSGLRAFDPFRKDKDKRDKSNYEIFSNGPYKIEGNWKTGKGGTFVKNKEWDAKTDTVRKQNVNQVKFIEGLTDETINNRLIADRANDPKAVTDRNILPANYSKITGDIEKRSSLKNSPYVFYLLPNFNRVKNPQVRQAIIAGADTKGWMEAQGGEKAYKPAKSIVAPAVIGYKANPAFDGLPDMKKAQQLLKASGEKTPYPLTFTYNSSPTGDKAAAALREGWNKVGFKVTLDPLTDTYYDVINKKDSKSDVVVAGWGADWATPGTVLPALFDSTSNMQGSDTNGNDYGNYDSKEANELFAKAGQQPTIEGQGKIYQEADALLAKDGAYVPIGVQQFFFLHGSKVKNYTQNPATSEFVDLGDISVEK